MICSVLGFELLREQGNFTVAGDEILLLTLSWYFDNVWQQGLYKVLRTWNSIKASKMEDLFNKSETTVRVNCDFANGLEQQLVSCVSCKGVNLLSSLQLNFGGCCG